MKSKALKKRLDVLLFERGLAETVQKARAMILAGEVAVAGVRAEKAGTLVAVDKMIDVTSRSAQYASRGGIKLAGAFTDFALDAAGLVCMDVGCSTGGFTDCLLQTGAARVYAVDVNVDQLAWKLRNDPRVIRVKKNARELSEAEIPERVQLVAVDVSFISVSKILAAVASVACPEADLLILVKPQFELPRHDVAEGGVVVDKGLHEKAIATVREAAGIAGLMVLGVTPSQLTGAEGNQEYFLHVRKAS